MKKPYEIYFDCGSFENVIGGVYGMKAILKMADEAETEYGERPLIREQKMKAERNPEPIWGYAVF